MKNVKWQMKENFAFSPEIGFPASADQLKVTPRFTLEKVEGRPKLTGIYHLAVNVNLEERKNDNSEINEAILIDDLDIDGKTGYFEYAVPFNIDFPPEADDPIDIKTMNTTHEIDENGCLSIIWDVECTYKEVGIHQTREEQKENQSAKTASAEAKKKEAVAEEKQTQTTKKEVAEKQQTKAEKKEAVTEVKATKESNEHKQAAASAKKEVSETRQSTTPQTETEVAVASHESESVRNTSQVVVETASFTEDEVLSFISELEDGISTTGFRLNDVLVQGES
ncbi:hypothetical protein [Sporosarcina pasteurii]|uniref:Stage VI sporulation protein D n=1 Tax=Sporosarcina pasteurii TaxID=1474 RepID=A0A380BVI6_SPOPA|nr:hypothetical protein [Sporosarcina pasteurii]MDS9471356.1 hypothetical protein [Sporosarcina pasteurii]QBQ05016.1 hypothetical protein E2C16_04725 [Sporosarcina pasteurii]SUJ07978.1 stage VI sporulation protein D [Sporosarcina pasteurii]